MRIFVVFWSGTGNTEAMAEAVGRGIRKGGGDGVLLPVSEADPEVIASQTVFALGCPSMGAEELEEIEMEPFVASLEGKLTGKKILLFGSYGWGDGEWMRSWEERMKQAGAELVTGTGIIANEAPDEEAVLACEQGGEMLASAVK